MEALDNKNSEPNGSERDPHGGDSMMGMMAMMMAMCLGVVLLFAVISTVGFPLGILIALGARRRRSYACVAQPLHAAWRPLGGLVMHLHKERPLRVETAMMTISPELVRSESR